MIFENNIKMATPEHLRDMVCDSWLDYSKLHFANDYLLCYKFTWRICDVIYTRVHGNTCQWVLMPLPYKF